MWPWKVKVNFTQISKPYISYTDLGHMLLLNTNRESYMENPLTPSHLTLRNIEGQSHGHSDFEELYLVKRSELGHMLSLNTDRKQYKGNATAPLNLTLNDLERSKSRLLRLWVVGNLYILLVCQPGCHIREFVGTRGYLLSQQSLLFLFESCMQKAYVH